MSYSRNGQGLLLVIFQPEVLGQRAVAGPWTFRIKDVSETLEYAAAPRIQAVQRTAGPFRRFKQFQFIGTLATMIFATVMASFDQLHLVEAPNQLRCHAVRAKAPPNCCAGHGKVRWPVAACPNNNSTAKTPANWLRSRLSSIVLRLSPNTVGVITRLS